MVERRSIDNALVATGTILLVLAFKQAVDHIIIQVGIGLAVVGLLVLVFGRALLNGSPSRIKDFLVISVGLMAFSVGIECVLEHHMAQYWYIYIPIGLILLNFHNNITEVFL